MIALRDQVLKGAREVHSCIRMIGVPRVPASFGFVSRDGVAFPAQFPDCLRLISGHRPAPVDIIVPLRTARNCLGAEPTADDQRLETRNPDRGETVHSLFIMAVAGRRRILRVVIAITSDNCAKAGARSSDICSGSRT